MENESGISLGGTTILFAIFAQENSIVGKRHKENPDQVNGDY